MQTLSLVRYILVLISLATFTSGSALAAAGTPTPLQRVAGAPVVSPMVPALSAAAQLTPLVIGLRLQHELELQTLIAQQSDPASRSYRVWLTPAEFTDRFSPSVSDAAFVTAYLASRGINVIAVSPNRLLIQALATKAQLDSLKVDARIGLPADIQKMVQSISGISCLAGSECKAFSAGNRESTQASQNRLLTGNSAFTPADIATAYNFPNRNNRHLKGASLDGAGMTLAVITAFNYKTQDLADFYAQCGICHNGKITTIAIGGETSTSDLETTIDVEQATSQAPAADLRLYVATGADFKNFELAFNQVVCDNLASVVSFSWGIREADLGGSEMLTTHEIFEEAAVQGIVIFASSGDDGAYGSIWQNLSKPQLATVYPSSDPLVTAVGGTTLAVHTDFNRKSETAWSGSGGGISTYWPRPSWQSGVGLPAFLQDVNSQSQKRNSCDVSLDADPKTGYLVRYKGQWLEKGGTSCATPNWAALWLLSEQAAKSRIGNSNLAIYAMANSKDYSVLFHDVTRGNNGGLVGEGYKAGKGWDFPSGWGTPDGEQLVWWLTRHR